MNRRFTVFSGDDHAENFPEYWPTMGWKLSTPQAQGMRSETLLDMASIARDDAARDPEFYLDSITVIRNGYIVAEFYPNENYPRGQLHVTHSATKSIISALVGYRPNARRLTNLPARAFRPRVSASARRHGLGPSATRMRRTSAGGHALRPNTNE